MGELVVQGSKYTDQQRIDAAILYSINGLQSAVSRELGIPETTISSWTKQEWWELTLAEARTSKNDYFIARYTELVDKGCEIALEKLPEASARDAMIIAATANDKLRLALNQPTTISGKAEGIEGLKEQFRQLSEQWDEKQANVVETVDKSVDNLD